MLHLRTSEWIAALAFISFIFLACRPGLNVEKRRKIWSTGSWGLACILLAALFLPELVGAYSASIVRDWLPCLLVFLFYRQAGQFVTRPKLELEAQLERLDLILVAPCLEWCMRQSFAPWILNYLEASYLSYYPVMPFSAAALYLSGRRSEADLLWTVVLLATCASCGMLAFVPTRPPRLMGEKWSASLGSGKLRALNLWILRRGSVQTNTFPSGHVAIAAACSLALWKVGLLWIGLALLVVAVSIALGAVGGRYHYSADVILGFIAAGAALLAGVALTGSGKGSF